QLRPKLQFALLGYRKILEHGKVRIPETRSNQNVAAAVSECTGAGANESSRVVPSLRSRIIKLAAGDSIRVLAGAADVSNVGRHNGVKRKARQQGYNTVDLPSAEDRLSPSRQRGKMPLTFSERQLVKKAAVDLMTRIDI